jgi:CO dehydrogenase maturation factor
MSYIIAVTGKGGVGKTTISSLIIKTLIARNKKPVLAVDADPNTCLDMALGVNVIKTIGCVREEAGVEARKGLSAGISKQEMIELKIAESLVEADDFDYMAMGRPEGPGCYCYANNVLKSAIQEISSNYPYVVLDNEAGLENLSRRIVQKIDLMVIVTENSQAGFRTVKRLYDLAGEMKVEFKKLAVVVNRCRKESLDENNVQINDVPYDYIIKFEDNNDISQLSENGNKMLELSDDNKIVRKINDLLEHFNI